VKIPCPQCGGEVHLREAEGFPTCPFCAAALTLDRSGVRPHYLYRPRLDAAQVLPLLRRWSDRHHVPSPVGLGTPRLVFYPFWRYTREGPRRLVPAWPTLAAGWEEFRPPDGEQSFFDAAQAGSADVVEASVPEAAARIRAFGETAGREGDLVHLPVYETTVRVGVARLPVAVDACSGTVVWAKSLPETGAGQAHQATWLIGAGVLMLAAAVAIRPVAIALPVLAGLATILYIILAGGGRDDGA
jgi:hypothetical protein